MDVLRPQLIWIGNRCYRKNPIKDRERSNPEDEEIDIPGHSQDVDVYSDEVCDANLAIEKTDKGFRLVLAVPNTFFKFIIGKKEETKRRLETETQTQIQVPGLGEKKDEIVILGHDRRGVVSAKTRIDLIVESARQRQQFTHFLSVPVTSYRIINNFKEFQTDVLRQCDGDRGLDASLFQNEQKLHLTLGTLVLLNDAEINQATKMLIECQEELIKPIFKGERLELTVQGLEYMNDDPGEVDVLYAKVEEGDACDRLQTLADRLVDKFTRSGLMQREHERVKLHITVMNTLMRKDPSGTSVPRPEKGQSRSGGKQRESFDATGILKKFGDYNFGSHLVDSIHLSQRYSTGSNGYYNCDAEALLPM